MKKKKRTVKFPTATSAGLFLLVSKTNEADCELKREGNSIEMNSILKK